MTLIEWLLIAIVALLVLIFGMLARMQQTLEGTCANAYRTACEIEALRRGDKERL
jgi:hypothetical protein